MKHNEDVMVKEKMKRKYKVKYLKKLEKLKSKSVSNSSLIRKLRNNTLSVDAYGASLQHTNRVLNLKYGFTVRYVPAHSPILIDKEIMDMMQLNFRNKFRKTSQNKFRSYDDMQYSFSYYYFIIHEKNLRNVGEVFDIFDTDKSGTWSDREIRTLLSKLYELPLSYMVVDHFEFLLINCSKDGIFPDAPTPEHERYIDSKLVS